MHSHSSAYQPVTGTDAYSHPLPGGSGALVIEIFLSAQKAPERGNAALRRSFVFLYSVRQSRRSARPRIS